MNILNDNRLQKLFATARKLGASEGSGQTSRAELFREMFLAASQDYLVSNLENKEADNVEPMVLEYFKSRAAKDKFQTTEEPKKITAQISKFRNAVTIGGAPAFRAARNGGNTIAKDFIDLCDARILNLASVTKTNPPVFLKLVKIMTDQKAKFKAGSELPMTEAEIDASIADKEPDPTELKDLRAIQVKLTKFKKAWPDASETADAALAAIAPRLAMLEGMVKAADLAKTLDGFTPEQIALALAAKQVSTATV